MSIKLCERIQVDLSGLSEEEAKKVESVIRRRVLNTLRYAM